MWYRYDSVNISHFRRYDYLYRCYCILYDRHCCNRNEYGIYEYDDNSGMWCKYHGSGYWKNCCVGYKWVYRCCGSRYYRFYFNIHINSIEDWCKIDFANTNPCCDEGNPLCYHANLYFNNVLVEDLIIPSTVTKITISAFAGCGSIKNIYLPKELKTIDNGAFGTTTGTSCINVTAVFYAGTIEDWMKMNIRSSPMQSGADLYCQNELVTNVVVPSTISTIKTETFAGCTSIVSVSMPNTVTTIDSRAFADCQNLQNIEFSDSLTTINYGAFRDCINLQDFTLPNGLKTIGQNAFNGCDSLVSVTIPASLTAIYQASITGDNLRTITILAETPPSAKQSSMFGSSNITKLTIYVPASAVDTYKQATYWTFYKNRICAIE